MTKEEIKKAQQKLTNWQKSHTPEERKQLYLESIPKQVHASMAFEGELVSLKMLEEYLKSLKKNTPQRHG